MFLDAQMDADGRWIIPPGTLSAFVKTAHVPNRPQLRAEPYAGVAHTSVWLAQVKEFCLFCGVAIALASMLNHVEVHLQKGEVVTDPRMHGEAEPCGFCSCSTGTCRTSIVLKKIGSMCPYVITMKPAVTMCKQDNMPRECSVPACSATPWFLNIKTQLARCHPNDIVDLTGWVVVSRDDENIKGQARKLVILLKSKITLKVAQAVSSKATSYSEASLGRLDWEWKLEEDASSAESRFADLDCLSSGNESSASSKDANSPSSSSSSSSSSAGVEVFPKRKAVNAKGTKRPITTPMRSAKK